MTIMLTAQLATRAVMDGSAAEACCYAHNAEIFAYIAIGFALGSTLAVVWEQIERRKRRIRRRKNAPRS